MRDRMRKNDDYREGYIAVAQQLEGDLRLKELFQYCEQFGSRDTFPFEEQRYLKRVPELAKDGRLDAASAIIADRRTSVWSAVGERAVLWKVADRCVTFLQTAKACQQASVDSQRAPKDHIDAYVKREDGTWLLGRHQRLVEHGAASCAEDGEIEPLIELCRTQYFAIAGKAQESFLEAVARDGWPPEGLNRQTGAFARYVAPVLQDGGRVALFLVDSMRYEMGSDLGASLEGIGSVRVDPCVSVLPTVTPFGMAALMPGADTSWEIVRKGNDLIPAVGGGLLPGVKERIALLKKQFGDRYADATLEDVLTMKEKRPPKQVAKADLIVVRTQEMDS